jgi:outer membrane protein OmpA-like peptidoglycan-associated protein
LGLIADSSAIRFEPVRFRAGSAAIDPAALPLLDDLAQALKQTPRIQSLEIAGHSSADEHDSHLSERRANAILMWLVGKGIDRARLVARGYGSSHGADAGSPSSTPESRDGERRVDFNILDDADAGKTSCAGPNE